MSAKPAGVKPGSAMPGSAKAGIEATEIVEQAPAKVNLALHVTGQTPDGYHTLDSLVAFADFGDVVTVRRAGEADRLELAGPFATDLGAPADNLITRARDLLRSASDCAADPPAPCSVSLEKRLPIASGIGGGSTDAAATLRALNRLWGLRLTCKEMQELSVTLGADLPMCIAARAAEIAGIGEKIKPIEDFPTLSAVLVNPLTEVSTPAVFRGLASKTNAAMPPLPAERTVPAFIDYLRGCRNDLEAPALGLEPAIGRVLEILRADQKCLMARMSGSGATCFALFANDAHAEQAGRDLARSKPTWWIRSCRIGDDPFGIANLGKS